MASYSQVVVGITLLVTAFFVGRYFDQQPMAENAQLAGENLLKTAEDPAALAIHSRGIVGEPDQQKTLRELILRKRSRAQSDDDLSPINSLASEIQHSKPASGEAIVEPDFSYLQTFAHRDGRQGPNQAAAQQDGFRQGFVAADPDAQVASSKNRFTINRPATNDRLETLDIERRLDAVTDPTAQESFVRPSFGNHSKLTQKQPNSIASLQADNPRYRMVPVRERIGSRNPPSDDFVDYTTVFGDTLHGLATRFYGTPDRYLDIYLANQGVLENPSHVPVNTVIRIPVMK